MKGVQERLRPRLRSLQSLTLVSIGFIGLTNFWVANYLPASSLRSLQQSDVSISNNEVDSSEADRLCGTVNPTRYQVRQAMGVEQRYREALEYEAIQTETGGSNGNLALFWNWIQRIPSMFSGSGGRGDSGRLDFWNLFLNPFTPPEENPNVLTYYHVIEPTSSSLNNGTITTDRMIMLQNDYLNQAFESTGFTFEIAGITRTQNDDWYQDGDTIAMKKALHKGDRMALNIYLNKPTNGNLGYATFPSQYSPFLPKDDGIVLLDTSLPGGTENDYNHGAILVHEVGHWLGLYHTFQNGCEEPGDGIDDTPFHQVNLGSCPEIPPDTCPEKPGLDPVRNYMNYLHNDCLDSFTEGQIIRMKSQWNSLRRR